MYEYKEKEHKLVTDNITKHLSYVPRSLSLSLLIPIVSQLRHVKEKLVSAQTRHTTRQNPRRMLFEILSNDLLKSFNVLIRSLPFRRLHFITLSKHKSQRYLIITTTNNQRETPQEKEKKAYTILRICNIHCCDLANSHNQDQSSEEERLHQSEEAHKQVCLYSRSNLL